MNRLFKHLKIDSSEIDYIQYLLFQQCNKPVIAAVHGGCIGGGVDLITAADIRYCTQDAFFQIKEVDIGKFRFRNTEKIDIF